MEDMQTVQADLKNRITHLEEAVTKIMRECCSKKIYEDSLRTNLIIDGMDRKLTEIMEENEKIKESVDLHKKYLHILMGVVITLEVLGIGEKLKDML